MREFNELEHATKRETLSEEQNKMLDRVHQICGYRSDISDIYSGSNTWFVEPYSHVARHTVEGYRLLQKLHGLINEGQYNYYLSILKDVRFGKCSSSYYKDDGVRIKEDLKEEYPDIKFRKITIKSKFGNNVAYRISLN